MIYQTNIKGIGTEAEALAEEKMVILFGDNAPDELVDFCYIIDINEVAGEITEENTVKIDDEEYKTTKRGTAARKTLNDLRHITLKVDGSEHGEQSGTLYLENKEMPKFKENSTLVRK